MAIRHPASYAGDYRRLLSLLVAPSDESLRVVWCVCSVKAVWSTPERFSGEFLVYTNVCLLLQDPSCTTVNKCQRTGRVYGWYNGKTIWAEHGDYEGMWSVECGMKHYQTENDWAAHWSQCDVEINNKHRRNVNHRTNATVNAAMKMWQTQARFPFKRNRLRLLREIFTQQTQAPANRNAQSKQWQPWLAACQRKCLRFLRFSFTQRKRLRLNGNRAWVCVSSWTHSGETSPHAIICLGTRCYVMSPQIFRHRTNNLCTNVFGNDKR